MGWGMVRFGAGLKPPSPEGGPTALSARQKFAREHRRCEEAFRTAQAAEARSGRAGALQEKMRFMLPATRSTLGYIMATSWAATAVVALTFVGFDLEIGNVPHLFTFGATFPFIHMASFIFGMALGLYYLKVDREVAAGLSQAFLGTAATAGLLFFFLSTDIFEGRMLLWCYDGMFLGFTGMILFLAALGKDAILGTFLRLKPLAESLGPISLTVYLFQGFFIGVSKYIVQVSNHHHCLLVTIMHAHM